MSTRTVDWSGAGDLAAGGEAPPGGEGLRERKKRLLRRRLSDTATELFIERGFDAVRVAEVAQACGVSEKTVFNYFPTKESLILDRWDVTAHSLRTQLADPALPPVQAAVAILAGELDALIAWWQAQPDRVGAVTRYQRFGTLIATTPSLRAYQRDRADQLVLVAARVLAARAGVGAQDPQPHLAAIALLGLWQVQARSLSRHLDGSQSPTRVRRAVSADVARAARLLSEGLGGFVAAAAHGRRTTGAQRAE